MKTESVQYDQNSGECTQDVENFKGKTKDLIGKIKHGKAASAGAAMGRAVVITNDDDISRVKDGSVIISKTASSKLAMVLEKAIAIATENGSQAANSMVFARVYGIPAVVGIPGLTEIIKDGDFVRVDGTNGNIEIRKSVTLRRVK
jgi:pyruvate,water dikinase